MMVTLKQLVRRLLVRLPRPYAGVVALLQPFSFASLRRTGVRPPVDEQRIGYVLWRYPTLSETFIRREVRALIEAGVAVRVFALEPGDPAPRPDPACPSTPVTYFGAEPAERGRAALKMALARRPLTSLLACLFVVRHRDPADKTSWRDRSILRDAARLAAAMDDHGITHVHAPWANSSALIAMVASRLLRTTFSVQARAYDVHRSVPRNVIADRLRFAEFCIVNSRYNAEFVRAQLDGLPSPPIEVIYNGVETDLIRPATRVEERRPLRVLAVGRLVEQKGFQYLLRACRLLRERGLDFSCEIIGGPVNPADTVTWLDLRMIEADLELESYVTFSGAHSFSVIRTALERADLFVLPCVVARDGSHDVTPNALIEAMATGLPVISTTVGAIPEIVDDGRDGVLVPPNDERALADAMERLLNEAALRDRLGAAARRTVEERFDIDRNAAARIRLFESLTAGRDAPLPAPEQRPPLVAAAREGNVQAIARLVDDGADINSRGRRGRTALHEAARKHADAAAYLIARGADSRLVDESGRTALEFRNTSPEVLHEIRQRHHRRRTHDETSWSDGSADGRRWAAELAEKGIVKIQGLISDDALEQMREEFGRFIESLDARTRRGGGAYRHYDEEEHVWVRDRAFVTNNAFKYSPTLTRLCCHPALLDAANLYLGRVPHIQRGGAMRYLPSPTTTKDMFGWHHDMEEKRFKVMVLLTGVGEGGQHMSYIVGSHTLFHPYEMFFENPCSLDYCRAHMPAVEVFDAVGSAGDVFIFDSNGAHRGNRSESADIRDVFMVEYTADTSHIWGGDVDRRVLDGLGPMRANPFERLIAAKKVWEQPLTRRAPTWIENLPHVERWL